MSETERRGGRGSEPPGRAGEGEVGREGERTARATAMEWVRTLVLVAVLFVVIRFFFVQTFVITSGSMEDTLLVGDFLIANRTAYGARIPGTTLHLPGYADPERGEVVVFDPHHEEDLKLVKRLVGMPGDTLQMVDGRLLLDGTALAEPYARHESPETDGAAPEMAWQRNHLVSTVEPANYRPTRDDWGPLVVPQGHFFLLGDNRDSSYDSRYWGPLAQWRVEARASLIYYSYDDSLLKPFPWITAARWGRIGKWIR